MSEKAQCYFLVKDERTPVENLAVALETAIDHLVPHKDMYIIGEEGETYVYFRWYPLPSAAVNSRSLPRSYNAILSPDDTGVWIIEMRGFDECGCGE